MAIAVEASQNIPFGTAASLSTTITVDANADAVVVFLSKWRSGGSQNGVTAATLGGQTYDELSQDPNGGNGLQNIAAIVWFNPPTGSQTLSITQLQTSGDGPTCSVLQLSGVDTTGTRDIDTLNWDTSVGAASSQDITLTTVSGDFVVKYNYNYNSPPSLTSGWTNLQTQTNNGGDARMSYITATGTSTLCTSEDENYANNAAVAFTPASGGSTSSGSTSLPTLTASGQSFVIKTADGAASIPSLTASGNAHIWPKVWLNTTASLSGATPMTVTAANAAGTSITFNDPPGPPTGNLFLGVENSRTGDIAWIAVTVNAGAADQEAVGTPSLPSVTASGAATVGRSSTGTPSTPSVTAAGAASVTKTAAASTSISALTASGVSGNQKIGSGAASLTAVTASGAASVTRSASGAGDLPSLTASGATGNQKTASGTPSLGALTAVGAAEVARTATSAMTLPTLTASGAATVSKTASGTPELPSLTASGAAGQAITASGTPSLAALTASGNAYLWPKVYLNDTQTLVGATEVTVTAANEAGTSITFNDPVGEPTGNVWLGVENRNNGAVGWIQVTVVPTGDKTASGTPSLPGMEASGVAERVVQDMGSTIELTLPAMTASGAAQAAGPDTASGTPSITALTAAGVAEIVRTATAAGTMPSLTASGATGNFKLANGTPQIPTLTASGAAEVIGSAFGAPSLPTIESSGSGIIIRTAQGTITLPSLEAAGSVLGGDYKSASGAATLAGLDAAAIANVLRENAGIASIGAIEASGAATVQRKPTGDADLPSLTAAGTVAIERSATAAVTLPALQGAGTVLINALSVRDNIDLTGRSSGVTLDGNADGEDLTGTSKGVNLTGNINDAE